MTGRVLVLALAAAGVLLVAGSASGGKVKVDLSVGPGPYSYGEVAVGSTASETFTVSNLTRGRTAALAVSITGTGYSLASDGCTGARLSGSGTCSVTVAFAPSAAGDARAVLSVDGGHDGFATSDLTGTGAYSLSMTIRPNDGFDQNGIAHLVPGGWVLDDDSNYLSGGEWRPDPSPVTVTADGPITGNVGLSSSCPLEYSATGPDTFGVTLGDTATFGATFGVTPASRETAGVDCTLTASAADAIPATLHIRVAGEWCDGVDNNGNRLADENYLGLGKAVLAVNMWGRWTCSPYDHASIVTFVLPDQTKPPFVP